MPAGSRRRLLALIAFRDEARFLPGFFENVVPQVDGVIALDDQSTDDSAAIAAARPEVLEVISVPAGAHGDNEDSILRRALIEAAWEHDADWLLGIDADERVEDGFRERAEREIDRAEAAGHDALWVPFLELWEPRRVRVDGIWGAKRKACLFRSSRAHGFDDRRIHTHWASLPEPEGSWPEADLRLYHLRMVDPADRVARRERYRLVDPDNRHQASGYDYMLDATGLELVDLEPGRAFTPAVEEVAEAPDRRLLIAPTLDFGGMELQMIELARALGHRGGRSTILAGDGPLAAAAREVADVELIDWERPTAETAARAVQLARGGVAVLPAHPALMHLLAPLTAAARVHLCVHNRPGTFEGWLAPDVAERFAALLPALHASGRVTFTASNTPNAAEHARRLGLPPGSVSAWFPGVEAPGDDEVATGPVRTVAVVARLSPEKLPIVAAGAELVAAGLDAGADVRLEVHGDGIAADEARALLAARLPAHRFAMLGATAQPLEAAAAAGTVVNAGRAAIEALVLGCRVVTPRLDRPPPAGLGPPVLPGNLAELKEGNFVWRGAPEDPGATWERTVAITADELRAVRDAARRELSSEAVLEGHLAALARIDAAHGGADAPRGEGLDAVMALAFPLVAAEPPPPAPPATPESARGGPGRFARREAAGLAAGALTHAALLRGGAPYPAAAAAGAGASVLNAAAWHRASTFRDGRLRGAPRRRFWAVQAAGAGATVGLTALLVERAGVPRALAQPLAAAPVVPLVLAANRVWTFR